MQTLYIGSTLESPRLPGVWRSMGSAVFSAFNVQGLKGEGSTSVRVPLPTASLHWALKARETCFYRLGIQGWRGWGGCWYESRGHGLRAS